MLDQMKKLDIILASIQALDVKIDLERLKTTSGAAYDFVDRRKEDTIYDYCLPGTRREMIKNITLWCHKPHQTVFWICGMAGTGKSTLVRTVAKQIEIEGLPVASFFFRQEIADQKDGSLFVPSIVAQLLKKYPILRPHVAAALEDDLMLPGGPMSNQFTQLLKKPMSHANLDQLVLVIDALDECHAGDAKIILVQLAQLAKQSNLRIIITSRPEPALRADFNNIKSDSIRLEEIRDEVEADIRQFFQSSFKSLVEEDAIKPATRLSHGWPDDATIEQLVQLTNPLFIFAATLYRYVKASTPIQRLKEILEENQHTILPGIGQVYLPILKQVYAGADKQQMADFRAVVGSIVLLRNPLSIQALSGLLERDPGDIYEVLDPLHSVLSVPNDLAVPVRILHKSFMDFLLYTEHEFRIDDTSTNMALLESCLKLMDNLREDICSVSTPSTKRSDIDNVSDFISPELEHACLYWTSYVNGSIQDNDQVHQFLQRHFLHWVEALSWLGRFPQAIKCVSHLRQLIGVS